MNTMTKRGSLDNVVTYEHICDTYEDLENIDPKYATLGSTAVVINEESGLEAYMANSAGEWVRIATASGGGGGGGGGITPTGTYNITENGTYNVSRYARAKVEVPQPIESTLNVTQNGVYMAPENRCYYRVDVNVSNNASTLKKNEVILPDATTMITAAASNVDFDGYKNVVITPKTVDATHSTTAATNSVQLIKGEDLIVIPEGTKKLATADQANVVFNLGQTLPEISCYKITGSILVTLYIDGAYRLERTYILDDYIVPNCRLAFGDFEPGKLLIYLSNNSLDISFSRSFTSIQERTEATISKSIILEKVGTFTTLDTISYQDGQPFISNGGYQLDREKINFSEGQLYAILANTYDAGNSAHFGRIFEPFIWDAENGYKQKKNLNINFPSASYNIAITPEYKLIINDEKMYPYGTVYICSLNLNNIKNYLDYATIDAISTQTKTITPTTSTQVIAPDIATIYAQKPTQITHDHINSASYTIQFSTLNSFSVTNKLFKCLGKIKITRLYNGQILNCYISFPETFSLQINNYGYTIPYVVTGDADIFNSFDDSIRITASSAPSPSPAISLSIAFDDTVERTIEIIEPLQLIDAMNVTPVNTILLTREVGTTYTSPETFNFETPLTVGKTYILYGDCSKNTVSIINTHLDNVAISYTKRIGNKLVTFEIDTSSLKISGATAFDLNLTIGEYEELPNNALLSQVTVNPISLQTKTVSPSYASQTITADSDYQGLSEVTVNAISEITFSVAVTDSSLLNKFYAVAKQSTSPQHGPHLITDNLQTFFMKGNVLVVFSNDPTYRPHIHNTSIGVAPIEMGWGDFPYLAVQVSNGARVVLTYDYQPQSV